MRRICAALFLSAAVAPGLAAVGWAAAAAAVRAPVVDLVEIAGPIDRPIARYVIERIASAERDGSALVVLQVDSLGGVKIADADVLPPLVRRIRDARVPVAVHIGPRGARAQGAIVYMAAAANVVSMGPSARIGEAYPVDLARPDRFGVAREKAALVALAAARGRVITGDPSREYRANEARRAGFADEVVPSVAELLRRLDGRAVTTAAGLVRLNLPEKGTIVRFTQPGPLRRLLHTFSSPTLVYLMLIAAALMIAFDLSQGMVGVAGVTGALVLVCAVYGLTVLPARASGLALLGGGLVLLAIDVVRDELLVPTLLGTAGLIAGSLLLLPGPSEAVSLSPWVVALGVVVSLIVFIPVLTYVHRRRAPLSGR